MRSASRPLAVLALAAALPLAGCILEDDSDRRPIVNETIVYNSGIQSEVFVFDGRLVDYYLDGLEDQQGSFLYETDALTADVTNAGLVMLYVDAIAIDPDAREGTWTALPLTFGIDSDPDGDGPEVPDGLVDFTTTLGYSLEPGFLYVDTIASTQLQDGFDYLGRLNMRLVTIPPGEFLRAEGLDFTDYEAVQRFYGLPN